MAEQASAVAASKHKYHVLDGLRGVAAIAIVMRHSSALWGPGLRLTGSYLAVDLFFVLSGFVLAYAYDGRFAKGMTAAAFMKARLIRLYPLFALACVIKLVFVAAGWLLYRRLPTDWTIPFLIAASLCNLLFLPAPPNQPSGDLYPLNSPSWSLFFEMFINLLFAVLWPRLSQKLLAWICTAAAALLVAASFAYGEMDAGYSWATFFEGLARVCFSFPMGVLLYRTLRERKPISLNPLFLYPILVLLFWIPATGQLRVIYNLAVVLFVFPAMVAVGGLARTPRPWVRVFNFLGLTSYAIYVLQEPVYATSVNIVERILHQDITMYAPVAGMIFVCSLLAGAWLLDNYYDMPLRTWLGRSTRGRKTKIAG